MKKKKTALFLETIGYFLLVLAVLISGALLFHTFYYELIYVSGTSMAPTLSQEGDIVDFGILDTHESAKKHLKRFDIVSSYYPTSVDYYDLSNNILRPNAKKKLKRIIAMPNETFEIRNGLLYLLKDDQFELIEYPFETLPNNPSFIQKDTFGAITLEDDEYWLLGDNRANSYDCASPTVKKPVKYENLAGVLVAIEGRAKLYIKYYVCPNCGKKYSSEVAACEDCDHEVEPFYDLKDKRYHWPRYF